MNREDAQKVDFYFNGVTINGKHIPPLDEAIAFLIGCRGIGQNVYIDFNGAKLYSCDVTMDSAYLAVLGVTKAEDESIRTRMEKATSKEEKAALIQEWSELRKSHQEGMDVSSKKEEEEPEL